MSAQMQPMPTGAPQLLITMDRTSVRLEATDNLLHGGQPTVLHVHDIAGLRDGVARWHGAARIALAQGGA